MRDADKTQEVLEEKYENAFRSFCLIRNCLLRKSGRRSGGEWS